MNVNVSIITFIQSHCFNTANGLADSKRSGGYRQTLPTIPVRNDEDSVALIEVLGDDIFLGICLMQFDFIL